MNDSSNKKKWALILGGSSGIGLATAKKMALEGMNICIVHRDFKSQETNIRKEFEALLKYEIDFRSYNADATDTNTINQVIEDLKSLLGDGGKIHLLLHSISRGNLKTLFPVANSQEFTETTIDSIDPHFEGTEHFLRHVYSPNEAFSNENLSEIDFHATIKYMATSLHAWAASILQAGLFGQNACIVGLTSEGRSKVLNNYAAVSAAKGVLEALMRAFAIELAPHDIRSNIIQAGVTDTPSLRRIPGAEKIIMHSLARNPFCRLTVPEDVANVIYLLTTPEAKWINGAVIPVDGGEHLR